MESVGSTNLLIIGKIPPPIGGVTIHVTRLLQSLRKDRFGFVFFDLANDNILSLLFAITKSKVIHLHTSNSLLRFLIVLFSKLLGKSIVFTFHGNLLRYTRWINFIDKMSIRLSDTPILINQGSYDVAIRLNSNSSICSAFIPPVDIKPLAKNIEDNVRNLRSRTELLFCTNAFNVSFDKNGREIYGILDLVKIFSRNESLGLVVSDPSGAYVKYLVDRGVSYSSNVYFISEPHDFINVVKLSDCFIRCTTTDGDSLSVKESLFFNTPVIASDCVHRPSGCLLYETHNFFQLEQTIREIDKSCIEKVAVSNGYTELIKLYESAGL